MVVLSGIWYKVSITLKRITERLDGYKGARSKRSVTSHNITIEMAVYIDAAYTQTMLVTDFSKRLQHILLKYYAVGIMESSLPMG